MLNDWYDSLLYVSVSQFERDQDGWAVEAMRWRLDPDVELGILEANRAWKRTRQPPLGEAREAVLRDPRPQKAAGVPQILADLEAAGTDVTQLRKALSRGEAQAD